MNPPPSPLSPGYEVELWRPSPTRIVPDGLPLFPFAVWWSMHITGVFGAGYSVLLIRANGKVVHRSVVTPKYFRFPFMAPADLQAGDVWTSEDQRGLGLAGFALRYLLSAGRRGQTYWYLVEEDNVPSVRTAKRSGLRLAGYGGRTSRLGLRLLGTYQIFTRESADAERIVTPIPH